MPRRRPAPVFDFERRRRTLPFIVGGAAVALIPWTVHLAVTLPGRYDVQRWRGTWVGFDLFMALSLALTAYSAWRRRITFIATALIAGTMLLVDAWFDVRTASRVDRLPALLGALVEIPAGVLLLTGGIRLLRRLERGARRQGTNWWAALESGDDEPAEPRPTA